MAKYFTASRIAKLGIFSALSVVLYFLSFPPLPIFPSFLTLNLSDIPMLICGFAMGPVSASIVVVIKILIKLPFSHTACVGEVADLIIGLAFVLPSSIIYMKNKTKKRALVGMLIGGLLSTVIAMLANWLILIPFYSKALMPMETIVNICSKVMPFITMDNFYQCYIFISVLPFNLLRCLISTIITFLLYKSISGVLKRF